MCDVPRSEAVCLKEIAYLFKGPLPTATTDETRVPCHPADEVDLLSPDSSTPALVLDVGKGFGQKCGRSERISITNCCRDMIQQLRFDYEEASGVVGTTL